MFVGNFSKICRVASAYNGTAIGLYSTNSSSDLGKATCNEIMYYEFENVTYSNLCGNLSDSDLLKLGQVASNTSTDVDGEGTFVGGCCIYGGFSCNVSSSSETSSVEPSSRPRRPSGQPSSQPTGQPTGQPSGQPSGHENSS